MWFPKAYHHISYYSLSIYCDLFGPASSLFCYIPPLLLPLFPPHALPLFLPMYCLSASLHINLFLLFSFKPVPVTQIVLPVREQFEKLFHATFSLKQNAKFLANIQVIYLLYIAYCNYSIFFKKNHQKCFAQQQWQTLFKMMQHSLQAASKRLEGLYSL